MTDDGSSPRSNADSTFQHNVMPPEPSAAHANMASRSIFIMVREVRQYLAHGAVEPVSPTGQTGHGGPVPTGSGALVAHPASPKIIASVPHVLANFS